MVNASPWSLYTPERHTLPIVQEAECAADLVWMGAEFMYIKYLKIMDNVQHQCMPINNWIRNMAIFRNCEYGEPFVSYRLHFKCCCFA